MLTNIRRVACVIGTLAAGASILALPALAQEARPAMMKRLWPALAILVFLAAESRAEKEGGDLQCPRRVYVAAGASFRCRQHSVLLDGTQQRTLPMLIFTRPPD
jgi:hypothetical protein